MAEIYNVPDGNNGNNDLLTAAALMGNNNGLLGGGGLGGGIVGFLLGMLFPRMMNGMFGGYGLGYGGMAGGAGTAYLGNMISNDNGRDIIMQAVTSQGEQSRTAIQTLSTMLGQDFNLVNAGIQGIQSAISQVANAQGINALQVINAIQAGNASIISQFQQFCCQNQLAIAQQTADLQQGMNTGFFGVQQGINGVSQAIASKSAADQLAMCQQTYNLTDTMNRNYLNLDNKIDAMESSRKDRELAAKDAEIAALKSQNFTAGVVQQAVAPINAQLAGLSREVDDIKCKLPNTVNVEYPNLVAINATPYMNGGYYGYNGNLGF